MKRTDVGTWWVIGAPWRASSSTVFVALVLFSISLFSLSNPASAFGEIFEVRTRGIEYCGDFNEQRFSSSTGVPLWVRVDSDTRLTVSLTPNFAGGTTFPMYGYFYQTRTTKAAFIAGVHFEGDAFATIQGDATFDRNTGLVKSLKGIFVQNSVLYEGCFSSGKFSTRTLLNY